MKAIDNLVEARTNKCIGNHGVKITPAGRYFTYHNNVVCKANDNNKNIKLLQALFYLFRLYRGKIITLAGITKILDFS